MGYLDLAIRSLRQPIELIHYFQLPCPSLILPPPLYFHSFQIMTMLFMVPRNTNTTHCSPWKIIPRNIKLKSLLAWHLIWPRTITPYNNITLTQVSLCFIPSIRRSTLSYGQHLTCELTFEMFHNMGSPQFSLISLPIYHNMQSQFKLITASTLTLGGLNLIHYSHLLCPSPISTAQIFSQSFQIMTMLFMIPRNTNTTYCSPRKNISRNSKMKSLPA